MKACEGIFSGAFVRAAHDYLFLLERGYTGRALHGLVGDRYGLSSTQRIVLRRGVDSQAASLSRSAARKETAPGVPLSIDLFNVLFTLTNYLYGRVLFVSTDGFLRDNGEEYGKHVPDPVLAKACGFLIDRIVRLEPSRVDLYVDAGYETCNEIVRTVGNGLSARSSRGELLFPVRILERDRPDDALAGVEEGTIATADSSVITRAAAPAADLACETLSSLFSPDFPDLRAIASRG